MIKTLALIMTLGGAIALVVGVLAIFDNLSISLSPYAVAILGVVFFFAGISLLKYANKSDKS